MLTQLLRLPARALALVAALGLANLAAWIWAFFAFHQSPR